MPSFVTSSDGTRIAFDRLGQGPPVVTPVRSSTSLSRKSLVLQALLVKGGRRNRAAVRRLNPRREERKTMKVHECSECGLI